jgi:hypothetical protein
MTPKEEIIGTLERITRSGIHALIEFLDEGSDFFTAPCSTVFHLNKKGGLAEHTWNVVLCARELNVRHCSPYIQESIDIAAIGHDLCKANFYKETDEKPTDAQMRYLTSLLEKARIKAPAKLNKAYVSVLIDFMLHEYRPGTGLPAFVPNYVVEDQLPLGHGEKSLYVLREFIELTVDEALAIRWHMSTFDAGIHFDYPSGFPYREAVKRSKLVTIIQLADIEATNLVEV